MRLGPSLSSPRRDRGRDRDGDEDGDGNDDADDDDGRRTPALVDGTNEVPLSRSGFRQGAGSDAERRRRGVVGATLGQGWMEGEKKGGKVDEGRKGVERVASGSVSGLGGTKR